MNVTPVPTVETDPGADIFDPRTYAHGVPYAAFARLRRTAPVTWVEEKAVLGYPAGRGYWAVLRHADVKAVLRDPARFSSQLGATQIRDPATPADLAFVRRMLLNLDPPEHTRLRGLIARSFTPVAVARLEATIRARAAALVAAVADEGEADLAHVAADLPLVTLAEVMGMPVEDRLLLYDWSNRVIGYQDAEYAVSDAFDPATASPMAAAALAARPPRPVPAAGAPPVDPRSRAALVDMFAYAHVLAAERRARPGDDVFSILLHAPAEAGQPGISDEELENMFFLFAVAGNETLRNGIPGALYTLLTHPDQLERLRRDPTLIGPAVEECLRVWPPVIHFRRTATVDTEIAGHAIAAGDKVVVYHASANRDETVFADPDRVDLTRSPNDHVSFGFGPHFCLGAHLARVQMRALVGEVVARLEGLELVGPAERLQSNFQNGIKHLPVRWRPGSRSTRGAGG